MNEVVVGVRSVDLSSRGHSCVEVEAARLEVGFRREHSIASEKAGGAHGPLRASANVRMSVRFDYQPDICKDYKETGYCGYGDSCKFMHDRGDYKSGWQLDREWNEKEKQRRELAARDQLDDEDDPQKEEMDEDDDLPFACFICRRPFIDPVVTKCKHYFCALCALKHNSTSKNCAVCEKPTGGVFNTAREIVRKMQEEKEKASGTLDGGKRSRGSWRSS
ncbi:hypothetical protein CBR_g49220 [Chara braunii]|uniref:RING-type E3 ubiquitin transferase n=1 Tax=Chara braunii TaxID=69332 RepID=A0A388M4M8_CHABU|nr:hypothetical protein CBR_g49220 [Chara braunii]|eukprot:GBG89429.1 hypothetical protein CBR_g49220 [Chara braunii]